MCKNEQEVLKHVNIVRELQVHQNKTDVSLTTIIIAFSSLTSTYTYRTRSYNAFNFSFTLSHNNLTQ